MNKHVECITDKYECLTKGKIYKVDYEYLDCIIVTNDEGRRKKISCRHFWKINK